MATLENNELKTLWQDLEPNKRNRALLIARLIVTHGTPEQKALYTEKIKAETFPCDERHEALQILASNKTALWLSSVVDKNTLIHPPSKPIRMDVESGRLSIALYKAAEFRLWSIDAKWYVKTKGREKSLEPHSTRH